MKRESMNLYIILIAAALIVFIVLISKPTINNIVEMKYAEYENVIAKNTNQLIYVGKPTCHYCNAFAPILNKVAAANDITVNYVNTDSLTKEEANDFYYSLTFYSKEEWGTPLLLIVRNKEVIDSSIGLVTEDILIDFLKKNDIIKEW